MFELFDSNFVIPEPLNEFKPTVICESFEMQIWHLYFEQFSKQDFSKQQTVFGKSNSDKEVQFKNALFEMISSFDFEISIILTLVNFEQSRKSSVY